MVQRNLSERGGSVPNKNLLKGIFQPFLLPLDKFKCGSGKLMIVFREPYFIEDLSSRRNNIPRKCTEVRAGGRQSSRNTHLTDTRVVRVGY